MDKKEETTKTPETPENTSGAETAATEPAEQAAAEKSAGTAEAPETAEQPAAEQPAAEQPAEEPTADATAEEAKPAEEEKPAATDWKDRYARAMADFDNFRKRTARDREDLVKFAAADVIKDVLATVDNLALALDKAKDKAEDPFVAGVKLVYDGLLKTLADHGASPLDSVGEPFDANFHEALAQLPSPDVAEGLVMNEVKRGWLLHGKLLRAAQVVVSAGNPA